MSDAGSGEFADSTAVIDGVDVDAVVMAVRSCAAVDDLYSTSAALVASYLPGRQVAGVQVAADAVTVQVRSRWAVPAVEVAGQLRAAVQPLPGGRRVDVVIADIADAPTARVGTSPAEGSASIGSDRHRRLSERAVR